MAALSFRRTGQRSGQQMSFSKYECSAAKRVVEELKEKMSRIQMRLLDCQNQNQMLRKELLLAKKVINTEVKKGEKFQNFLNQSDFRGRQENIFILRQRLSQLQERIKELEGGKEEVTSSKADKVKETKVFQNKKAVAKELQHLLDNACRMRRKMEVWKKRNSESSREVELLRVELEGLLQRSQEDETLHESHHAIEKELRARQAEKLAMRNKLDLEKTRNGQLAEELGALKEDLSVVLAKINDDKVLIETLKSQQGHLVDLLERQRLVIEEDSRKFRDDVREVEAKHSTNNHVLDHLKDCVENKTRTLECLRKEIVEEKDGRTSSVSVTTDSSVALESEPTPASDSVPAHDSTPASDTETDENEMTKTKEELERHKQLFRSASEETEQIARVALSNNNKMNEWSAQLSHTHSLLARKNAEIRELLDTQKKLENNSPLNKKKESTSSEKQGPNCVEEIQKKSDALREEHQFLSNLWNLLLSNQENCLHVYLTCMEFSRKRYEAISEEDGLSRRINGQTTNVLLGPYTHKNERRS